MEHTRIALLIFGLLVMALLAISRPLMAQTTMGSGSIVGIVSDPSGAIVAGAEITIAEVATGQVIEVTTNPSGCFHGSIQKDVATAAASSE